LSLWTRPLYMLAPHFADVGDDYRPVTFDALR
jgi:hypothetical protein